MTAETFIRWHRKGFQFYWRWKSRGGRPALPKEIRQLIARMVKENITCGEERIADELLLKLGRLTITKDARTPAWGLQFLKHLSRDRCHILNCTGTGCHLIVRSERRTFCMDFITNTHGKTVTHDGGRGFCGAQPFPLDVSGKGIGAEQHYCLSGRPCRSNAALTLFDRRWMYSSQKNGGSEGIAFLPTQHPCL